ncbi:MAG: 50S ribosomal protein L29 [Candidatus Omnitrophota bacterium]|nr:MAG: 50S ribosomal protein L29 [Candidatus Omnitrophota bacterium]
MANKTEEYKDYTKLEIEDKLRQLEEELFTLRVKIKAFKLDKPHRIKLTRRNIARLKTFLKQIELKENNGR